MTEKLPSELSVMQSAKLKIFDRCRDGYAAYAFAISSFSIVESGLLSVFVAIDDRAGVDSISAHWCISSCRGRYDWINKRMKGESSQKDFSNYWHSISSEIENAIDLRNELAHGEFAPIAVSHDREIIGYWPMLSKMASTGDLSFNKETVSIEGGNCLTQENLIERGLHFIQLSEKLFEVAQSASADRN